MTTYNETELKKKHENFCQSRDEYETCIDEIYKQNPPFPANRNGTEKNFGNDIDQIVDIIIRCIEIGQLYLINKYIIKPLEESFIFSAKAEYYIEFLKENNKLAENKDEPLAKHCLEEIEKALLKYCVTTQPLALKSISRLKA